MATREIITVAPAPNSIEVFCSYSHRDLALRQELEVHLKPLQAQGLINYWQDHSIPAGEDWESQIDERLNSAKIVLLLVSADFMASKHCQIEMRRALELRQAGKARVIPILLRHVDWHGSPLGKIQALPKDGRPVTNWPDRDQAFKDVTIGIRRVAEKLIRQQIRGVAASTDSSLQLNKQPPGSTGVARKYAAFALAAVLVLSGLAYLGKRGVELKRLSNKDWAHVLYNDPDLSNCMDVPACVKSKSQADAVMSLTIDWRNVNIDFPLLSNCMGWPACVERADQAARLKAVRNWAKIGPSDQLRLKGCMGVPGCLNASAPPRNTQGPIEEKGANPNQHSTPTMYNPQ